MFEIAWQEFKANGSITTKTKRFETETAMSRFIEKLFQKDSFYRILETR